MANIKHTIKSLATSSFDKRQALIVEKIIGSKTISLLDVGAANGVYDRWSVFKKYIDYFAVEPDSRSSKSVLKSNSSREYNSETLITKALWHSEGEVNLNLCRKPMASSIYEPNREFTDLFPEPERNDIVDKVKLPCETAGQVARQLRTHFDVIKLDVQGAELDVLRGSTNSLEHALAIDIEVEFCELYKDQPLFDQVFRFCEKQDLSSLTSLIFIVGHQTLTTVWAKQLSAMRYLCDHQKRLPNQKTFQQLASSRSFVLFTSEEICCFVLAMPAPKTIRLKQK